MQPHPPLLAGAASFAAPGELNTDNCFCTALLSQLGQLTFSLTERMMVSNRCSQRRQLYSKIGMNISLLMVFHILDWEFETALSAPRFCLGRFGDVAQRSFARDRYQRSHFQSVAAQANQMFFIVGQ